MTGKKDKLLMRNMDDINLNLIAKIKYYNDNNNNNNTGKEYNIKREK